VTATSAQTSILEHEPSPAGPRAGHLLQLDGLRTVAIALVLTEHLLPLHRSLQDWFPSLRGLKPGQIVPPLGFVGVSLFFVLSGFLITRILLDCRQRRLEGGSSLGRELRVFYLRRTLRIFPLYYATLLLLALLPDPGSQTDFGVRQIHDRLPYHLTYTFNWLFSLPEHYGRGGFERHFWSLCVEEQFYLLWPWVILLAPRRWLVPALLATFALGPAWRAWFHFRDWPWQFTMFPTPACLDLLAAGGLVAVAWNTRARPFLLWGCLLLGVPAAAMAVGLYRSNWLLDQRVILQQTALALCFAAFVGFTAKGVPVIGKVLAYAPIAYLGKISYAMYVFHNFTPPLLRWATGVEGFGPRPWLFAAACVGLTIAMSAASWALFEGPINRLKDRIPYARAAGN
jgi:peptidoglycan/LPS O-acetylase OafA/YrhL